MFFKFSPLCYILYILLYIYKDLKVIVIKTERKKLVSRALLEWQQLAIFLILLCFLLDICIVYILCTHSRHRDKEIVSRLFSPAINENVIKCKITNITLIWFLFNWIMIVLSLIQYCMDFTPKVFCLLLLVHFLST